MDGPLIPKVVAAFRRHWWASFNSYKTPLMIKPYNRALGAKENNQTSLRPVGNAPPLEPIRGDEFYNFASQNGKPNNRASPDGNAPLLVLRTTSPKGKHVTGFSGRFAPLRIQFLCHPGGGSLSVSIE